MSRSINYQFIILQAIGIILVVVGHKGGITLFTDWFPPYSFHMPMFIFISGYFYKKNSDENLIEYVMKKFKNLMIPYFIWNLIYGIIVNILRENHVVDYGSEISLSSLFRSPWINGHQFALNIATWFVPALFIVQVIYIFFRKLCKYINFENEYIIMLIFAVIGCLGVLQANKGPTEGWNLTIIRTMFLIPFFHLGYLYNQKLEKKDNINNIVYFIGLFIIQFILIKKYNYLDFSAAFCSNFNKQNIFLPYITSITGIMFWLRISRLLVDSFGRNKVVNYIGNNTWTIMMHHQFVFFIINAFFALIAKKANLIDFNYEKFRTNIWYGYDGGNKKFLLFYVIAGIGLPLIFKYYIEKVKDHIKPLSINIFNIKVKNNE